MNCEGLLIYDLIFVDDLWKFFCAKEALLIVYIYIYIYIYIYVYICNKYRWYKYIYIWIYMYVIHIYKIFYWIQSFVFSLNYVNSETPITLLKIIAVPNNAAFLDGVVSIFFRCLSISVDTVPNSPATIDTITGFTSQSF